MRHQSALAVLKMAKEGFDLPGIHHRPANGGRDFRICHEIKGRAGLRVDFALEPNRNVLPPKKPACQNSVSADSVLLGCPEWHRRAHSIPDRRMIVPHCGTTDRSRRSVSADQVHPNRVGLIRLSIPF
jgi:hypothetical protein